MMTSGNYPVVRSRWIITSEVLSRQSRGWRGGWGHVCSASKAMLRRVDRIHKEICGHWGWGSVEK